MFSSLSCAAASGVNNTTAPTILSQICGLDSTACSAINTDATAGKYGAYSVCNLTQQVSWAMNQYYLSQNNASTSCNFGGQAKIQSPSIVGTQCQAILAQVGPVGTGIVTSLPSSAPTNSGKVTSSGKATGSSSSPTGTGASSGESGGDAASSGGSGLTTGAKAGVAVAAVLIIAAILAGIAFYVWRRKSKMKSPPEPPLSGEGGLEVGDAPPQFTALRRAEMEAREVDKPQFVTGEPRDEELAVHDIILDHNELDTSRERQEMDGTGTSLRPRHAELDATGNSSGLNSSSVPFRDRGEPKTIRSELSPTRKPLSDSTAPIISDPTLTQSPNSAPYSNTPWSNPGIESFGAAQPPATHQSANETSEALEMRRIEEEERRIDAAIAESERLQALRKEKEELQKRKLEMMAGASGGGGSSSTAPS
ncbi:hypothetical protein G7Y89_g10978 [Cudoniella acicularis]|uniref:X8 domain-containing protein n=1 Tax=Cudoniella acicularis TaxID=354080 RepID=A0A8H4RE11_9HELO|nr:hypothetical protein G7Y89_g10978 [Cudoniella acicularis]